MNDKKIEEYCNRLADLGEKLGAIKEDIANIVEAENEQN